MNRAINLVGSVCAWISGHVSGWVIFFLMLLVVTEATSRYLTQSPLKFADEFGGYSLVAITIIGLGHAWKERGHIRINVLVSRLPVKVRSWLRLITTLIATAFVPVLIHGSYKMWEYAHRTRLKSISWLRLPMEWPQLIMIIGFSLLFLVMIADSVQAIRTLRTPGGKLE